MEKRKSQIVEPEEFDPNVPTPDPEEVPETPELPPVIPGNDDDSDDETDAENEAVR